MDFYDICIGVLFITAALFSAGQSEEDEGVIIGGRIIMGETAQHKDFPYLVSIQMKPKGKWKHQCGGSILTRNAILTACHCVAYTSEVPLRYKDANITRIVAGVTNLKDNSSTRQERSVQRFIAHPKCSRWGRFRPHTYYDAAVIELTSPLEYNYQVKPLRFYSVHPEVAVSKLRELQKINAQCLSPGWGRVGDAPIKRSTLLKVARQTLRTDEQCLFSICHANSSKPDCQYKSGVQQLCAESKDGSICNGDSGGPLVCDGQLFGVTSQVGKPCKPNGMQIFTDIDSLLYVARLYYEMNSNL